MMPLFSGNTHSDVPAKSTQRCLIYCQCEDSKNGTISIRELPGEHTDSL